MPYWPDQHHRRSMRLSGYDYTAPGAYFVTICAEGRRCLLGEVENGAVQLSLAGAIVAECWASLPDRFQGVALDTSVIMPNHLHATILVGARFIAPAPSAATTAARRTDSELRATDRGITTGSTTLPGAGAMNRAPTGSVGLGEMMRTFKALTTRRIRLEVSSSFAWQRNYFEHVLRSEERLDAAQRYIQGNPAAWREDPERPR